MKKKTSATAENSATEQTIVTPEPAEADAKAVTAADKKHADKKPHKEEKPILVNGKVITKKEHKKRTALRWVLMNIGVLMMAASVYFFQTPNHFTLGGVAGIAIIISNYVLTQATVMAIINVALIIIGLIILGRQCTFRTIYCSLMYTGIIYLFEELDLINLLPHVENTTNMTVTLSGEPFLELCYAILLFGIGGALIFNCGSSSGGTDIIALILKKFTSINVGMALMIVDMIVVFISIIAFDIPSLLYSCLGLFAKSFLLDGVIESIGKTKYITIITNDHEKIADYILHVVNHSFTIFDAEGGYTGDKKKVMVTVCKRGEALKLKYKVKQIDPSAFIIITDANEILGKGFGVGG